MLLGDEAQVEACLRQFGDSANLDARTWFVPNVPQARKIVLNVPNGTPT
jgi:hypothetical protein